MYVSKHIKKAKSRSAVRDFAFRGYMKFSADISRFSRIYHFCGYIKIFADISTIFADILEKSRIYEIFRG
ncbi:hypothetical protein CVD25_14095 [Bacillus canaveralius]|uniref:Uncharacterized protein n=1 Tax=Bacillus canaveralius TaxID=1403243 RepID=A0A2N5GLN1_9BACI|nr:hypothetical protein CU635_11760 [Bacillus canaveralius]PLR95649.1 hypothetical protein CVD25_14095 [Bacillus canaveralius]